jgi:hypothetical protein
MVVKSNVLMRNFVGEGIIVLGKDKSYFGKKRYNTSSGPIEEQLWFGGSEE